MLFEYLSGEVAFPLSVLELASACVSLLASTPLHPREPTDVFGPIYNPFDTRHLYSNSFAPLCISSYLGLVMGLDAITLRETRSRKDRRYLLEKRSVGRSVRA
jgi:hypothetical protein